MDFPPVGVTPDMGTAWIIERYCNKKCIAPADGAPGRVD